ncbi:MAG: metallophosphoesterase [Phormidesmis priestleyi]|uniref:Metallophosphoesterase n=1 Tax=Phormidesmis priestleyi TaxID=268141 RepID=A0A2W4WP95_9CYAN|nr:MAG: metallophosphoesterase [Phormidesmis priestleyi]
MKDITKKIKYTFAGIGGLVILLVIWGLIEPHLLNTEKETAKIPNLPAAWEGKQIGQLSDFQIGMWAGNPDTSKRSVEQMIEANPAVVLISGDFIYQAEPAPAAEIEKAVSIVKPLVDAGIPTYAVLGNHDYGMSSKKAEPGTQLAKSLESELEAAGIVVLENESVAMQLPDSSEPLYLAAVDSLWSNHDNVGAALSDIPEGSPRVALMHNPDSFELFPANAAPLALAGHTHGGQIRLPNSPQWSWLRFTQGDKVYADGWAKGYGKLGNNLYVNVGIGMSIIPIRLFCPPEMTLFTLESDD